MSDSYTINDLFRESVKHGLVMTQGDEPFHPFMNVVTRNGKALNVLVADDIQEALDSATGIIARQDETPLMYAIVWDGRITVDGEKTDCIMVEIAVDSSEESQIIAQPYTGSDPATASGKAIRVQFAENRIHSQKMVGPFTYVEWNKLIRLPVLIFLLVAGADGEIDKKEISVFVERLGKASDTDDLFSALLISASNNFGDIYDGVVSEQRYDKWGTIELIIGIAERKVVGADFAKFKADTLELAESIAKSSGGFLGFGSKIGKEEKQVISKLKGILKI